MKMRHFIFWIALCIILSCQNGCRDKGSSVFFLDKEPPSQSELSKKIGDLSFEQQLKALSEASPKRDAEIAFANGDQRFVALMMLTLEVPHSNESTLSIQTIRKNEFKIIWGTAERPTSSVQEELEIKAFEYAKKYNDTLLGLLSK